MNSSETPLHFEGRADNSLAELQAGYQSLKSILIVVLVFLVVLSASFNVFLLKQVGVVRKQVEDNDTRVKAIVEEFDKNFKPLMGAFVNNLFSFARSNPDFIPILQKYQITMTPSAASAAPAAPKK